MRVVFLGDSLTEGVGGASYLDALRDLAAMDPLLAGIKLMNAGRSGDTALHLARRVPLDVAPHQPDWVMIFVGANDATTALVWRAHIPTLRTIRQRRYFARRHVRCAITPARFADALRLVVDTISATTSARVALCTPATVDEAIHTPTWRLLGHYATAVHHVAAERDCQVIDLYSRFTASIAHLPPRPLAGRIRSGVAQSLGAPQPRAYEAAARRYGYSLTHDGIHFTQRGAALVASALADWLRSVTTQSPD